MRGLQRHHLLHIRLIVRPGRAVFPAPIKRGVPSKSNRCPPAEGRGSGNVNMRPRCGRGRGRAQAHRRAGQAFRGVGTLSDPCTVYEVALAEHSYQDSASICWYTRHYENSPFHNCKKKVTSGIMKRYSKLCGLQSSMRRGYYHKGEKGRRRLDVFIMKCILNSGNQLIVRELQSIVCNAFQTARPPEAT